MGACAAPMSSADPPLYGVFYFFFAGEVFCEIILVNCFNIGEQADTASFSFIQLYSVLHTILLH